MPGNLIQLRRVHRTSALIVGIFAVVHIAHHLLSLNSVELHLSVARLLRNIYRNRWIEPTLLFGVAVEWATGLALAYRRWRRPEGQMRWMFRVQG